MIELLKWLKMHFLPFFFFLLYFLYIGRVKTYCDIISDALTILKLQCTMFYKFITRLPAQWQCKRDVYFNCKITHCYLEFDFFKIGRNICASVDVISLSLRKTRIVRDVKLIWCKNWSSNFLDFYKI